MLLLLFPRVLSSRKKKNTSRVLQMISSRKERLKKVGGLSFNTKVNHPEEDPRLSHKKNLLS